MLINISYHKKKGSQHAKKADMIIPSVLAAFLSRFILLLAMGCICMLCLSRITSPIEIPLICRCLSSSRAATLLLGTRECFGSISNKNGVKNLETV